MTTDIRIHDADYPFDVVGIVSNYSSLIWTERFNEAGDFELYMPMSKEAYELLSFDRQLSLPDTTKRMIIESQEIKETEGKAELVIKGRSLESILDRRMVLNSIFIVGTMETAVKKILELCVIDTYYAPRDIPHFLYEDADDGYVLVQVFSNELVNFYGELVLDIITDYCKTAGVGFQIELDSSNNFVFKLYAGEDKTIGQTDRPPLMFAKEFDNLRSTSFFRTKEHYKTDTLVIGQIASAEGVFPPTWLVLEEDDNYIPGLGKREIVTDASDINRYTEDNELIPLVEYSEELLNSRGKHNLLQNHKIFSYLEATIDTSILTYRADYFLGDLLAYRDSFGNYATAIVSEVIISEDNTGKHTFPVMLIEDENHYDITELLVSGLLIGGGGAGGAVRGGGGGGGLVLQFFTTIEFGQTYPVVVGAGGTGVSGASGNNGGNSTFNGEIGLGGGGGGKGSNTGNAWDGNDGGNGGGGGGSLSGTDGFGGDGKNPGGDGSNGATNYGGGGGGGDGEEGQGGYSGYLTPGRGGDGLEYDETGTPTYYAGGGGGYGSTSTGAGGLGGGGNANASGAGQAGTNGLGGGGGAGSTIGGNGGSGLVVLRIPTLYYSGVYTGSPTVSVVGSYTVLKFTQNGSYTA